MDERMTLEKTLSVIDRSIRTLREAGYPAQADELTEARVPVSAHLTQPAQAVDVGAIQSVIARLHETSRIELRVWSAFAREQADKLTRAIGNAQAEGWRPIETAPKDGSRVLTWAREWSAPSTAQFYGVKGWMLIEATGPFRYPPTHWQPLPTPPTQATPNAHE